MGGTTIFVGVIVALFLAAMIAFQIYIHSGKDEDAKKGESERK